MHRGTIIATNPVEHLREAIASLADWGAARGWVGPDPYEGLNASRLLSVGRRPLARRMIIQTVKRSPLDLRRLLGIAPWVDAATLAHVLSAYSRLGSSGDRLDHTATELMTLRSEASPEPSWGYHFDVETRFFFYAASTPNSIATAFAGHALIDAHLATGRADLLAAAGGAGRFFLDQMGMNRGPFGAYFGYFPGDAIAIHNANALVCSFLGRLHAIAPAVDLDRAAKEGIRSTLGRQRSDGAWAYSEGGRGDWVDNLHTGYVLDAVRLYADVADESIAADLESAYGRGLEFYEKRLFLADGTPKFLDRSVYPIDAQNAAQGIRTFSMAARLRPEFLDRAWRVYAYAASRLRRRDGAYVFQRHRLWTNRVPHPRWVQAPMLDAFTRLLNATATGEGTT